MRSLFYDGPKQLSLRDVPFPKVQADHEVVVKTIAATSCYVDTMVINGRTPLPPPFALGHESVGQIVDMGDAVTDLQIGDVVSIPNHRTCGGCKACVSHDPLHCEQEDAPFPLLPVYGTPDSHGFGGMFSDAFRVPYASHALIKIPQGVDPIAAVAAGDTLTDAWHTTVPHIRKKPDARVLITSNAGYGLYAAQWSLAAGAAEVLYVDDDPVRLAAAKRIGATTLEWTDGLEVPPVYDVIVNERQGGESLRFCLLAAAHNAIVENVVIYLEDVPIPLFRMHFSGVQLRSSFCPARLYMPDVLSELARGTIDPRKIESETFSIDDAAKRMLEPSHKPIVMFE
jgi:alcohol dehydrogenase